MPPAAGVVLGQVQLLWVVVNKHFLSCSHSLTYCPWLLPCCSGGDEGLCQSCKRKFASDPPR